jgi:hypothetical protein
MRLDETSFDSGLNANYQLADLADQFRELRDAVEGIT